MNKKGQGISINVIIIAAIALLVLVILAVLVLRGGKDMQDKTSSCLSQGGICREGGCNEGEDIIDPSLVTDCDYPSECCSPFSVGE